MVKPFCRNLASAVVMAVAVTGATAVRADDDGCKSQRNAYIVNKLVSDQNGVANFQDPVLRNAWGVAFTPRRVVDARFSAARAQSQHPGVRFQVAAGECLSWCAPPLPRATATPPQH